MKNVNLNIPVSIFVLGAILFLIAPLGLFPSFTANQIYLASLLVESTGITVGFVMYFRDKITQMYLDEI